MDTVILVDGHNVAYANYHTHKQLVTETGIETGVVHGFLESLLRLDRLFPRAVQVVLWDGGGNNWRKAVSRGRYKANRILEDADPNRQSVSKQIKRLTEILEYLQVPMLKVRDVEADDLVGICATEFSKDFDRVIIRSSDKDFFQLVSPQISVLRGLLKSQGSVDKDSVGGILITPQKLKELYNLTPRQWVAFRAVTGDKTDGLQGMAYGVGEVKAAVLVQSGLLKLPSAKKPMLEKLKQFRSVEITDQAWRRVNENFQLSQVVTDAENLTREQAQEIKEFLRELRQSRFQKKPDEIEDWKLLKMLGELELMELAQRFRQLEALY